MKLLVVGGGGREHAIIKKLKENQSVTEIFATPGNGGIAKDATCVNIGATDLDGIVAFAKENAIAAPTTNKKNGNTRSVGVQPTHFAWASGGKM